MAPLNEIVAQTIVGGEANNRCGKALGIVGVDEFCRVADDFGDRATRRRDDRTTADHCFQWRDSETLVSRRVHEARGGPIERPEQNVVANHVLDPSTERSSLNQGFFVSAQRRSAETHQLEFLQSGRPEGGEERREVLVAAALPDIEHVGLRTQTPSLGSLLLSRVGGRIDTERKHTNLLRVAVDQAHEIGLGRLRDREDDRRLAHRFALVPGRGIRPGEALGVQLGDHVVDRDDDRHVDSQAGAEVRPVHDPGIGHRAEECTVDPTTDSVRNVGGGGPTVPEAGPVAEAVLPVGHGGDRTRRRDERCHRARP